MTIKKGSLILLDYTAKIKDNDEIFETTREDDAKKSNLYDPTKGYEPRLISVGEGWVLKGLDDSLSNANIGDKLSIELTPDKAFGERDSNKVRMIAQRKLGDKAAEIKIGDVVEIEDRTGIIRYVGSGRVQIDYNHRLAGRILVYDVNIVKQVETSDDKVKYLIKRRLPINDEKLKFDFKNNNDLLEIELPEEILLLEGLQIIKKAISTDLFKFVNTVKQINFLEVFVSPNNSTTESKTEEKSDKDNSTTESKTEEKSDNNSK
ncbi:MAG: FKBP-type peptidyl-prolyl cis-trans isomerase [Nitrososphaeraceae archaeon]